MAWDAFTTEKRSRCSVRAEKVAAGANGRCPISCG
jgi:hypothetical protein